MIDDLDTERAAQRRALLDATLFEVPFEGWTPAAIRAGAASIGTDALEAKRLFPGGPREMIEFWNDKADADLLATLQARPDLMALKIRERVALGVRLRLEAQAGKREAVRRALSFLALPQNAPMATRSLYRTVDTIWHAIGDKSTDFSFYTKRGLLSGVYASTVLYWLDDRSDGSADTWAFLDRRIADVMRIPQITDRFKALTDKLPNPFAFAERFRRPT